MEYFLQQVISGLASGIIYGSLALAVVIVYKAMGSVNFAQGEMALFSTFLAWFFISLGWPYWLVVLVTLVLSFIIGYLTYAVIFKPIEKAPELTIFMVILALFIGFNGLSMAVFGTEMREFPTPLPQLEFFRNTYISVHVMFVAIVVTVLFIAVGAFFKFTRIGLIMRATAMNRLSSELLGVRVNRMIALSWAVACTIGAVSGMLVAPMLFLDTTMMYSAFIYATAGALLGGLSSPVGAVIGGLLVGVIENLVANYVPFIGNDLKLTVALFIIILVSLFKPAGIFGKQEVERV